MNSLVYLQDFYKENTPYTSTLFFSFQNRQEHTVVINLQAASLCITKSNIPSYKLVNLFKSEDINRGSFVIEGQLSGQIGNQTPFTVSRQLCSELLRQMCGRAFIIWMF